MTQQFHEGQEVEVAQMDKRNPRQTGMTIPNFHWRKAKIVNELRWHPHGGGYFIHSTDNDPTGWTHSDPIGKFTVQFPGDSRAVFDAEHIRVVERPLKVGFDEAGSMVIE